VTFDKFVVDGEENADFARDLEGLSREVPRYAIAILFGMDLEMRDEPLAYPRQRT